jgi:hypothetical protein
MAAVMGAAAAATDQRRATPPRPGGVFWIALNTHLN